MPKSDKYAASQGLEVVEKKYLATWRQSGFGEQCAAAAAAEEAVPVCCLSFLASLGLVLIAG